MFSCSAVNNLEFSSMSECILMYCYSVDNYTMVIAALSLAHKTQATYNHFLRVSMKTYQCH